MQLSDTRITEIVAEITGQPHALVQSVEAGDARLFGLRPSDGAPASEDDPVSLVFTLYDGGRYEVFSLDESNEEPELPIAAGVIGDPLEQFEPV